MKSPLHVDVAYSLPTHASKMRRFVATDEDTKVSAEEVACALETKGAAVKLVPVSEQNIDSLTSLTSDCIFNLIEWDGLDLPLTLKAVRIIEEAHIPFTGSGSEAINQANNKATQKRIFERLRLPTPKFQIFESGTEPIDPSLPYPIILKPSLEHCSIGLGADAIVTTPDTLRKALRRKLEEFRQPIIADEFIAGREFQVTVVVKDGRPVVLPPAEVVFLSQDPTEFLTYESRWDETSSDFERSTIRMPELDKKLQENLINVSERAFTELGHRDYDRVDIRSRGSDVYILEANTNPGLGDDDDYGMTASYKAAGMSFADFVWKIVESCLRRSAR